MENLKRIEHFLLIIVLVAIIAVCGVIIINYFKNEHIYPLTGIVVNVSHANDTVTIEDANGNYWQFTGAEDWEENDLCSCIMNDNGTKEIKDDKIVKVRYCGGWSK